jgi:hypothetical protein
MRKTDTYQDEFEKFVKLQRIVVAQRREFLKKFTHEQLLDYTSQKDVKHWLGDIYLKKTKSIAPDAGGMKTNPKVVWTKNHVPFAILAIYNRREAISSESIKDELDKFPDSIDEKKRKMYTENGIKKALAKFNKDTEKWLIDNKQLEDI